MLGTADSGDMLAMFSSWADRVALGIYLLALTLLGVAMMRGVVGQAFKKMTRKQEELMKSMQLLLDLVHLQENLKMIREEKDHPRNS